MKWKEEFKMVGRDCKVEGVVFSLLSREEIEERGESPRRLRPDGGERE